MRAQAVLFAIAGMFVGVGLSNIVLRPELHLGYVVLLAIGLTTLVALIAEYFERRRASLRHTVDKIRERGPIRLQIHPMHKPGVYRLGHGNQGYFLYEEAAETKEVEKPREEYD